MILDFSAMQENVVPHFKGGKGDTLMRKQEDVQGKILQLTLPVGSSIGQHVHEDSYEVMYILSGSGVCYDEGQEVRLLPGMCHYCPVGHGHSVVNDGKEPLVIFAVVPNVK